MRKWFVFILIAILGAVGIWFAFRSSQPESASDTNAGVAYYSDLRRSCADACCRSSVDDMEQGGWQLESASGCPVGFQSMGLRCPTSKRWCERTGDETKGTQEERCGPTTLVPCPESSRTGFIHSSGGRCQDVSRIAGCVKAQFETQEECERVCAGYQSVTPLPPTEPLPDETPEYQWSTSKQGPYRDRVSYATGSDPLTWTDSGRILAEHASVPGAVVKDGEIFVYFVDVSEDGKAEQLGLIRSRDDGKTWTEKQIITIQGVGSRVPVDPAPFLLDDGRIRLYYYDIDWSRSVLLQPSVNMVYSAISADGVQFTQEEGKRIALPDGAVDPDIVKVGDTWLLYAGDPERNLVYWADSGDGRDFTYEGIVYQGGAVPDVFYENGTYYLYTAGIEIATSRDGENFTKTGKRFGSSLDPLTADPSVVKLGEGRYLLFYKTKNE